MHRLKCGLRVLTDLMRAGLDCHVGETPDNSLSPDEIVTRLLNPAMQQTRIVAFLLVTALGSTVHTGAATAQELAAPKTTIQSGSAEATRPSSSASPAGRSGHTDSAASWFQCPRTKRVSGICPAIDWQVPAAFRLGPVSQRPDHFRPGGEHPGYSRIHHRSG